MSKNKTPKINLVSHVCVWLGVLSFWVVYNSFHSQNFNQSIAYALSDTLHYVISFYIISLQLLPRFLHRRKIVFFSSYFFMLVLAVCTSRMAFYGIITSYFHTNLPRGFPAFFYTFTTTLLILAAASSIKLAIDWLQSQKHIEQIEKEKVKAELDFLKGQLNPHFLFNSINTLYGSIDRNNEVARTILLKLSDMLRYQLYDCGAERISVEKEIQYIENYIKLQQLRMNSNLKVDMTLEEEARGAWVAPLLLAPFVENAFKHGSRFKTKENWIKINLRIENHRLNFYVANSLDLSYSHERNSTGGIGLENIRRRLNLIYTNGYDLKVEKTDERFSVNLKLDLI